MESYVVRIYRRSPDSAEVVGVVQFIEKNIRHHFRSLNELVKFMQSGALPESKPTAAGSKQVTPQ